MTKKLKVILIIITSIIIGAAAVFTALRVTNLGLRPVSPSAPESSPKAQSYEEDLPENITPDPECRLCSLTGTPTPTETLVPGASYCDYLTVLPSSGRVSLTVKFSGKGFDSTRVKGFRFSFGDGEKREFLGVFNSSYVQEVEYIYRNAGSFKAVLEILDNGDHWLTRGQCKATVTVSAINLPTTTPVPSGYKTPTPSTVINTPIPTTTKTVSLPTVLPTEKPVPTASSKGGFEPTPTDVSLEVGGQEPGLNLPTLWGVLGGFAIIAVGFALVL
jgi:hypothetical protein